ncbi:DNA glycosylase AlkZ-like family protein [Nonomuraea sp. NPDC049028]|uniref:DNA glycosylase AlkZ-like family protein n=1 Tax=Nonomuraea sp. NPDC049028 TaxID=3364348 RepID=UPI0037178445
MEQRPDRAGVGAADEPARLRPVRRAGRRPRCPGHPGTRPHRHRAGHRCPCQRGLLRVHPVRGGLGRGAGHADRRRAGPARTGEGVHGRPERLLQDLGHPAADGGVRPHRLTGRPARLARREVQGVEFPRRRPARGRHRPGPAADRRDALLAHRHRRFRRQPVLREHARQHLAHQAGHHTHRCRRVRPRPAHPPLRRIRQQHHPLVGIRPRRPLRRRGSTRPAHRRHPDLLPPAPLAAPGYPPLEDPSCHASPPARRDPAALAHAARAWVPLVQIPPRRPRLVTFRDERGRELFDLPDAPRPDPDTPAPVRFLYDFDNLLLSHDDRSRVVTVNYADQGFGRTNEQPRSVLVDGYVAATWKLATNRDTATLTVRPFRKLTAAEHEQLDAEGARLLAFLTPSTTVHDIVLHWH